MYFGNDERVAMMDGVDVENRDDLIVLVKHLGRERMLYDLAEDTFHGRKN